MVTCPVLTAWTTSSKVCMLTSSRESYPMASDSQVCDLSAKNLEMARFSKACRPCGHDVRDLLSAAPAGQTVETDGVLSKSPKVRDPSSDKYGIIPEYIA